MAAITELNGRPVIFVFGSNKKGVHGAGAAKHAREHFGAVQGCGIGTRNYSYAIPTKGWEMEPLPLDEIAGYVTDFIGVAKSYLELRPHLVFHVTRVGCGLAAQARGQTEAQADASIAPMFKDAPLNCLLPRQWIKLLPDRPAEGFWPHW